MLCRHLIQQIKFLTGLLCVIRETAHPRPQASSKENPSIGQHRDIFSNSLQQGSVKFASERPDSKYFWLHRPYVSFCHTISLFLGSLEAAMDNMSVSGMAVHQ